MPVSLGFPRLQTGTGRAQGRGFPGFFFLQESFRLRAGRCRVLPLGGARVPRLGLEDQSPVPEVCVTPGGLQTPAQKPAYPEVGAPERAHPPFLHPGIANGHCVPFPR